METGLIVEPGICGFSCRIRAKQLESRTAEVEIVDSECKQISKLSGLLTKISFKELFLPITKNPVYIAAQNAGCHPSCIIPAAVIKALEAAMEMAIPRNAGIRFEKKKRKREEVKLTRKTLM